MNPIILMLIVALVLFNVGSHLYYRWKSRRRLRSFHKFLDEQILAHVEYEKSHDEMLKRAREYSARLLNRRTDQP